jgi:hypothetical protein
MASGNEKSLINRRCTQMNTDKIRMKISGTHHCDRIAMVCAFIPPGREGYLCFLRAEGAGVCPDVPIYPTSGQKNDPSAFICRPSVVKYGVERVALTMPTELRGEYHD